MVTDTTEKEAPASPPSRWPKVVGTIGVILGGIMFVDKVNDLIVVPLIWTGDTWSRLLGPELGEFLTRTMPRGLWLFYYNLLGLLLGLMLIIGSLRLRNRVRSGVTLCRAWAWLSIAWMAVALAGALWWFERYGGELSRYAEAGWESDVLSGGLSALALLLAFPVFLLIWLSRAPVKEEYRRWGE